MLPEWALSRAKLMSVGDILDLVRKFPVPDKLMSPVGKLVIRLHTADADSRQKLAIIAALVYLVTFWDVVPDVPIVGFVDDLAVIMSVLKSIES